MKPIARIAIYTELSCFCSLYGFFVRQRAHISMIRKLTSSYFGLVKKTIADAVPKAIIYMLVKRSSEEMQKEVRKHPEISYKILARIA